MKNVHGKNEHRVNNVTLSLPLWSAFHLAFWPSLAFVLVAIIARTLG